MALVPLAKRGLIVSGGTVNATAASGVTGAGLTARTDLLFGEVTEDFRAYGIANTHRHLAEMRTVLEGTGADADLIFTPHLLPVARGILATITVPVTETMADPLSPWRDEFAGEPFVEITTEPPSLRDVVRRNVVRISARHVAGVRQPTLLILSAIDNLVKGAAGQAVQNANVVLGPRSSRWGYRHDARPQDRWPGASRTRAWRLPSAPRRRTTALSSFTAAATRCRRSSGGSA